MKESIKLILFGFGIIGYLLAYGMNYPLAMYGVAEAQRVGMIDETGFNFFKYGYLVVGLSFLIGIVVYVAFNLGKKQLCSKCNSNIKQ